MKAAPRLKLVKLPKGTVIYREGEENNGRMYVVSEGSVCATRTLRGKERIVNQLTQGDLLGEMSFFTGEPRNATCTVNSSEARLFELTNDTFAQMVKRDPTVALRVIASLVQKLQMAERRADRAMT